MLAKHFWGLKNGASKMPLSPSPPPPPPVARAAIRFKAVVLLLLINCFMHFPLFVGILYLAFILLCITLCPHWFSNHLDDEERACCFALFVFLVSCNCKCSVALPRVAIGWSAVCY